MSYQYINSGFIQGLPQYQPNLPQMNQNVIPNPVYVNPYDSSIYNSNGIIYPFNNPVYQPKISQNYTYLG